MNTCKTCNHWESRMKMAHGECLYVQEQNMPELQLRTPYRQPQYQSTVFFPKVAYGYDYQLLVGPDFGCVHHKESK